MNQELWFPQPIWFEDVATDFAEAISFCKKLQSESDGRLLSNRNGWQSNQLDLFAHKELKNVTDIISNKIAFLVSQFDSTKFKNANINGSWVNINNKNSYNLKHLHPQTTFSGCIYLQAPEDSGNITFYRPDLIEMFPVPEGMYNPTLYATTTYKPRNGLILVFPAWLEHDVGISNSDEDRISIAFNILFKEA